MNDILNKIFANTNLTEEQREDCINSINLSISTKILESIYKVDKQKAVKLAGAIKKSDLDSLSQILASLKEDSQIKEMMEKAIEDTLDEFFQVLATSASEEQKQQIFTSLAN